VTTAQYASSVQLDFWNGDGMACIAESFFTESVAVGNPTSFQPEAGSSLCGLPWTKNSWGEGYQGCPEGCIPPVIYEKWIETRHTKQIVNRWATNHFADLAQAFFNGCGFTTWENVWGFWNQLSDRDAEATRRVGMLLRFLAPFLVSADWEPHVVLAAPAAAASIYASRWPSPAGIAFPSNATAWTLVSTNLSSNFSAAPAILVPCGGANVAYFDVYSGAPLTPSPYSQAGGPGCALSVSMEAGGYGAVIGVSPGDAAGNATLAAFLSSMRVRTARALASYSTAVALLPQNMTIWQPAPSLPPSAWGGMILIPSDPSWRFAVNGSTIEGRQFQYGGDIQYPWEALPQWQHDATIAIPAFYIDITPVTNAQYAAFLAASGYAPADTHNFLLDWAGSMIEPPPGWDKKPVTWVDLSDAVAYCAFYGKRLPNDWEWQYAMQGRDGRQYPWGSSRDESRMPPPIPARIRPAPADVGSYPNGSSPFGVLDGIGLIWQWTNPSVDEHTSSAIVRGSSYFHPTSCPWYFPNFGIAQINCSQWLPQSETNVSGTLWTHNKLMMMAPAYNRAGTLGFRCVGDV
jgi:iron(II)-dependent oxidoreductase